MDDGDCGVHIDTVRSVLNRVPHRVYYARLRYAIHALDQLERCRISLVGNAQLFLENDELASSMTDETRASLKRIKGVQRAKRRYEYFALSSALRLFHILWLHLAAANVSSRDIHQARVLYFGPNILCVEDTTSPLRRKSGPEQSEADSIAAAYALTRDLERATEAWRAQGRPSNKVPKMLADQLQLMYDALPTICDVADKYTSFIEDAFATVTPLVPASHRRAAAKRARASEKSARAAAAPVAKSGVAARPAVVMPAPPVASSSRVRVEDLDSMQVDNSTEHRPAVKGLSPVAAGKRKAVESLPSKSSHSASPAKKPRAKPAPAVPGAPSAFDRSSPLVVVPPAPIPQPRPLEVPARPPSRPIAAIPPHVAAATSTMGIEPPSPAPSPPLPPSQAPVASQAPPPALIIRSPATSSSQPRPNSSGETVVRTTQERSTDTSGEIDVLVPVQVITVPATDGERQVEQLAVDGVTARVLAPSSQEALDRAIFDNESHEAQVVRRPAKRKSSEPEEDVPILAIPSPPKAVVVKRSRQLRPGLSYGPPSETLLQRLSRGASARPARPHPFDHYDYSAMSTDGDSRGVTPTIELPILPSEDDDDEVAAALRPVPRPIPREELSYSSLDREHLLQHAWQPDEGARLKNNLLDATIRDHIAGYEERMDEMVQRYAELGYTVPRAKHMAPTSAEYVFEDDAPPRLRDDSLFKAASESEEDEETADDSSVGPDSVDEEMASPEPAVAPPVVNGVLPALATVANGTFNTSASQDAAMLIDTVQNSADGVTDTSFAANGHVESSTSRAKSVIAVGSEDDLQPELTQPTPWQPFRMEPSSSLPMPSLPPSRQPFAYVPSSSPMPDDLESTPQPSSSGFEVMEQLLPRRFSTIASPLLSEDDTEARALERAAINFVFDDQAF